MLYKIVRVPKAQYHPKPENADSPIQVDFPLTDVMEGEANEFWNNGCPKYPLSDGPWLISPKTRDVLSTLKVFPPQSYPSISLQHQGQTIDYYAFESGAAIVTAELKKDPELPKLKRCMAYHDSKGDLRRLIYYKDTTIQKGPMYWVIPIEKSYVLSAGFSKYDIVFLKGLHGYILIATEIGKTALEKAGISGLRISPADDFKIDEDGAIMAALPLPLTMAEVWQTEIIEKFLPKLRPQKLRSFIQENLRPALQIVMYSVDEEGLAATASKLYGRPSLPPGFDWPCSPEGSPLAFIGQFNLKEIQEQHDPENDFGISGGGMLAFFMDFKNSEDYAMGKHGHSKVCYFENVKELSPVDFPASEKEWMEEFTEYQLRFQKFSMIPDSDSPISKLKGFNQTDAWWNLWNKIEDMELASNQPNGSLHWHLFGYPKGCQGNMEYSAVHQNNPAMGWPPEIKPEEELPWRCLFNFSAEGHPVLEKFVGLGDFCFLIRQSDWESRNFDAIEVVGQWT
jgi:hypothetical protein